MGLIPKEWEEELDDWKSTAKDAKDTYGEIKETVDEVDALANEFGLDLPDLPGGANDTTRPDWFPDLTEYFDPGSPLYRYRGYAKGTIQLLDSLIAIGASRSDVIEIAQMRPLSGLAPEGTSINDLSVEGRKRAYANERVIAAVKYRNSPELTQEAYGRLRRRYMDEHGAFMAESAYPDDPRKPLCADIQDGICVDPDSPVQGQWAIVIQTPEWAKAVRRLYFVATGQIPDEGLSGQPGADPLEELEDAYGDTLQTEEESIFECLTEPTANERLGCISDVESESPGSTQKLLRHVAPWAPASTGKLLEIVQGLNNKQYLVVGGAFGVPVLIAAAIGVAATVGGVVLYRRRK